jgi:hypothetical protein
MAHKAGSARIQGLGIWAPRHRYRVIGTLARLKSSTPFAEGRTRRLAAGVVSVDVLKSPAVRITLCHTKFSTELMVCLATSNSSTSRG